MERLQPQIRPYAWGSHEALARLTGRAWPTAEPEAELWMGAHEADSSVLVDTGRPLNDVIAADPEAVLGAETAARFGGRLPFLLKVLAPVQALSIQAHPSALQAVAAPAGTYADGWPKPEAYYTLTDFHVFAGSRSFAETQEVCARLAVPELSALVGRAVDEPDPAHALLTRLLHLEAGAQASLADAVVTACAAQPDDPVLAAVRAVAEHHPHDIGLVVLLTMQHRVCRPGKYVYMPAGVLHAYTYGVAVEIMANSDNVVRAGLTQKKIDVDELLRIVELDLPAQSHPGELVGGWTTFPADTPYFQLRTARLSATPLALPGEGTPRILLATDGDAELADESGTLSLESGGSCFLAAISGRVVVRGDATVFLAAPGR